jgi:hypothetical protein
MLVDLKKTAVFSAYNGPVLPYSLTLDIANQNSLNCEKNPRTVPDASKVHETYLSDYKIYADCVLNFFFT